MRSRLPGLPDLAAQDLGERGIRHAEAQGDRLQLLIHVEPGPAAALDAGSGPNRASMVVAPSWSSAGVMLAATPREMSRRPAAAAFCAACAARPPTRPPPAAAAATAAGPPTARPPCPRWARRSSKRCRSSGLIAASRSSIALRRSSGVMFGSKPPRPPPKPPGPLPPGRLQAGRRRRAPRPPRADRRGPAGSPARPGRRRRRRRGGSRRG